MNIYWAENTDPRGGRFILAESIIDATKLALDSGMVKDIRNLTITKEPQENYQDSNINEITKPAISFGMWMVNGKKTWMI